PVSPIPPLVCPHLVLFSAHLPLPSSTLFPTRRSSDLHHEPTDAPLAHELGGLEHGFPRLHRDDITALSGKNVLDGRHVTASWLRSEEHTSELQSRFDLVCRLLLEKKKTYHFVAIVLTT